LDCRRFWDYSEGVMSASVLGGLARLVRICSVVAVLFIVAGLIGFLVDEVRDTSRVQATVIPDPGTGVVVTKTVDISQPDPPPAIEAARQKQHTSGREFIDDVGDVLMSPFTWIASGISPAGQRLLYSALALLVYGLLGQILADRLRVAAEGSRRAEFLAQEKAAADERKRTGTYESPA
jgi:hypothetical protein